MGVMVPQTWGLFGHWRIHLFEPLERILERASINVKLNGLGQKIQRHGVAASNRDGTAEINLYRNEDFLGTGSSIDAKRENAEFGTKQIRTVSVDSYLPDVRPVAIKIDVEGHELACLHGLE